MDKETETKEPDLIEIHLVNGEVITADPLRFQRLQYSVVINATEGKYEIPASAITYTFRPRRVE